MSIFKNFPKVSSIVKAGLLSEEDSLLVYKINRYGFTPEQMFTFLRSLNSERRAPQLQLLMDWYEDFLIKPSSKQALMQLIEIMFGNRNRTVKFMGYNPRTKCPVWYVNQNLTDPTMLFYLHDEGTIRIGSIEEAYPHTQ